MSKHKNDGQFDINSVTKNEVPLSSIRENPAALREVDKEAEDYQLLVESVKLRGVLNPVVVRKLVDPETKVEFFGLVDGLHRYNAAQDAGLRTIPVRVVEGDDLQALEDQIITNAHRVITKPVEFTKGIQRLMGANPLMTIGELATKKLGMSLAWVSDRLGLLKLAPQIQKLVDEDQIPLANAYALAKIKDHAEQINFMERAMTMPTSEFGPTVQARVKEIRDAARAGRSPTPEGFKPVPTGQKLGDIKSEFENPVIGPFLHQQLAPDASSDYDRGFSDAIKWVLHMDPESVKQQEADWNRRQEEAKAKKVAAAAERATKKAQDAQAAAAKAQEEFAAAAG